jgi:hypothetical protein
MLQCYYTGKDVYACSTDYDEDGTRVTGRHIETNLFITSGKSLAHLTLETTNIAMMTK